MRTPQGVKYSHNIAPRKITPRAAQRSPAILAMYAHVTSFPTKAMLHVHAQEEGGYCTASLSFHP